ncbi:MAG: DUF6427 family protein [Bacteroidota bacterium]
MSLLLFRTNHPIYLVLLPLFALIFWGPAFFMEPVEATALTEGLFNIGFRNHTAGLIFGWISVLIGGLLLNQVVNEREFFRPGSYLPGLMYVLLMVTTSSTLIFSSLHLAHLFTILTMRRCMSIYGKPRNNQEAFDAGFFIGIASLFNYYHILLVVALLICLVSIARLNFRGLLISFYGVITPWAFMLTLFFVIGYHPFPPEGFTLDLKPEIPIFTFDETGWWFVGIFALILISSLFHYLYSFQRSTLKMKAEKRVVLIFLIVQTLSLAFSGLYSNGLYLLPFIAVPLSIFLSFYFFNSYVKWLADLSFLAWLGIIGYNYFMGIFPG